VGHHVDNSVDTDITADDGGWCSECALIIFNEEHRIASRYCKSMFLLLAMGW